MYGMFAWCDVLIYFYPARIKPYIDGNWEILCELIFVVILHLYMYMLSTCTCEMQMNFSIYVHVMLMYIHTS